MYNLYNCSINYSNNQLTRFICRVWEWEVFHSNNNKVYIYTLGSKIQWIHSMINLCIVVVWALCWERGDTFSDLEAVEINRGCDDKTWGYRASIICNITNVWIYFQLQRQWLRTSRTLDHQMRCQSIMMGWHGRQTVIQDITQIFIPRGENPHVDQLTMDNRVARTHGTASQGWIWSNSTTH